LLRRQDDRVDEASKRPRGFRSGFWMLLFQSCKVLETQYLAGRACAIVGSGVQDAAGPRAGLSPPEDTSSHTDRFV